MKIILSENIYPVIQGEGKYIGKKMLLVRLYGCDLKCTDCDTKYVWEEKADKIEFGIDDFISCLIKNVNRWSIEDILITGGSPNLYQEELKYVFELFPLLFFHIEDNASKEWDDFFLDKENIFFAFSPKIGSLKSSIKINEWKGLYKLPIDYIIKIVLKKNDYCKDDMNVLINNYHIGKSRIYLMPYGKTRKEIIENSDYIIPICYKEEYNYSSRLHILLYNNERMK